MRALVLQGVVIGPVHIMDELEIVDLAGTNRPKVFGRLGRPSVGELRVQRRDSVVALDWVEIIPGPSKVVLLIYLFHTSGGGEIKNSRA